MERVDEVGQKMTNDGCKESMLTATYEKRERRERLR